jgi:peptidoglycan endopeptidase LytF
MYQSISFLKLGSILAALIIMLLQGCATEPYNTAPRNSYNKKASNTKTFLHLVRQGETLSSIAIRYNMDLKALAALNNISVPYSIKPGKRIRVYASSSNSSKAFPISSSSMSRPKKTYQYGRKSYNATVTQKRKQSSRGTQKGIYHTVKPNETLYGISKRYGKNYLKVARWNGISSPYELKVGQRLRLTPPQQKKQMPLQYSRADTGSVVGNQDTGNDKRPTSHIVQRGDTLYSLARRYGCTIGDLIYWNGLKPPSYLLLQGRRLRVAPPSPANKRPKKPSARIVSHIVQSGDTIETIAQHYGYTVEEIARWNGLEPPYDLSGGRRLRIAPPQQTAPPPTSMAYATRTHRKRVKTQTYSGSSRSAVYHTVVKGDTLYSLSRRFGHSVAEIMTWNHLRSPNNLSVGKRLQVALKGKVSQAASQTQTVLHHNTGYHTVNRGDTLYSISRTYGYSVPEVAEWNDLQHPYSLSIGQQLRVYPPSGIDLGGKRGSISRIPNRYQYQSNVNVNVHVVAQGDTLYSIAKHYGKALSQLIRWNKLQPPYTLSIGQRLRLSFSSTTLARGTTNRWTSLSRHHIVRKGDTLVRIAARYGVTPSDVSEWNGMGSPYTIYPGQKLLIAPP